MTERFTLISELGRGGMGVVWKARDEETGQTVALKLLHPVFAADPDYVTRFERELELAKRIHSRNVVQVLGYGVRDGTPYLALEYVDGPSLRELLASHGPYDWPTAKGLLAQIAQGLADAHAAGVVHRDLKPSNVLIGSHGVAKIADFGIAKGLDLTRVTGTSTLLGTPAYMPPEGPEDERSDLYSLGVIAYELLVGAPPFEGRTYQAVILAHLRTQPDLEKLPAEARPIVGWLLAKEPAERPQTAAELLPVLFGAAQVPVAPAAETAALAVQPAPARPAPPESTLAMQPSPASMSAAPNQGQTFAAPAQPAPAWLSESRPAAARRRTPISLWVGLGAVGLVVCLVAVALVGGFIAGASRSSFVPVIAADQGTPAATVTPTAPPTASPTPTPTPTPAPRPTPKPTPGFAKTGSMAVTRAVGATATLLSDGRVLVAGGNDGNSHSSLASAELYDPKTGTFAPTGAMTTARSEATATLLHDGSVLVAGGVKDYGPSGGLASAELYDPASGKFTPAGSMSTAREAHAAALLSDGRVLIAGGSGDSSAELYDPKTGNFSPTGSMVTGRRHFTASLLLDGRVLLAGGIGADGNNTVLASAELYDPNSGGFTQTGAMASARFDHTATTLRDGRVLIAGGMSKDGWVPGQGLPVAPPALLVYDPMTGAFAPAGPMVTARTWHTATLLADGRVLIAGGEDASEAFPTSAELFDPTTGACSSAGSMGTARAWHVAALLADGRVLLVGGETTQLLSSADTYTP